MSSILTPISRDSGSRQWLSSPSVEARLVIKNQYGQTYFHNTPAIVTSYSVDTGENVQFASALGYDVYAHILGRKHYTITVGGFLFDDCDSDVKGLDSILAGYTQDRASANYTLIAIALGDHVFKVLLTSMNLQRDKNGSNSLVRFRLVFEGVKVI